MADTMLPASQPYRLRSRASLRVEGGAAGVSSGSPGAVGLHPAQALQYTGKRAGSVLDSVPAGEDQGGRSGELVDDGLHGRRGRKIDALLEEGGDRPDVFRHIPYRKF